MRILDINKLEDCFDGSSVYRYHFDGPWDRERIHGLAALGKLEYFPSFPRPFFRVCADSGLYIKGVEGDHACRIIFPRHRKEELIQIFRSLFDDTDHTVNALKEKEVHHGCQTGETL